MSSLIELGAAHSCILDIGDSSTTTDNEMKCWGFNIHGQLGDGTTINKNNPSILSSINLGIGRVPIFIAAGGEGYTCAILADNDIICWGANDFGQLGDGTNTDRNDPSSLPVINLGFGLKAKAIGAGRGHVCSIFQNDNMKCWGFNSKGQLGDGTTLVNRNNPSSLNIINIGFGRTAKAVAGGEEFTCIIRDEGSVICWGMNFYGQLGDGTTVNKINPSTIPAVSLGPGRTAKAITCGFSHVCVILDNNTLKCWGYNEVGPLGDGTIINRYLPVSPFGLGQTIKSVTAGQLHTCVVLLGGNVKCWGGNGFGQLGDGTTADHNIPGNVISLENPTILLSCDSLHCCVILDDNSMKCWGNNLYGQLGDKTDNNNKKTPVFVSLSTNAPTVKPTRPTKQPTNNPTINPTSKPTINPTSKPTNNPTLNPTNKPTVLEQFVKTVPMNCSAFISSQELSLKNAIIGNICLKKLHKPTV